MSISILLVALIQVEAPFVCLRRRREWFFFWHEWVLGIDLGFGVWSY